MFPFFFIYCTADTDSSCVPYYLNCVLMGFKMSDNGLYEQTTKYMWTSFTLNSEAFITLLTRSVVRF